MKKAAIIAAPLAVMLFIPLLLIVSVAGVGGINQAVACTTAAGSSGGGSFGIGTLNWRGASHYKKNPHPGEQPYSKRVPNMVAKINASGSSIIGFQEFEPPQAQAFLDATHGQWALARGRVHGQADARDAIAYQRSAWTVAETRYVRINYGGTPEDIPLVRFSSTTGIGDIWVLNTHNPADVVNGSNAMRDSAVRAEAQALRQQQTSDPATPLFLTGDMNDKARFKQLFLSLAPGWSTANPGDKQIDWIMGGPGVGFTGTVVDQSTNDNAHAYTDHPFVHTTATVQGAAGSGPITATPGGAVNGIVTMVQANLPSKRGYTAKGPAGIQRIVTTNPDFITLNEQSHRSVASLTSAVSGYDGYRDPAPDPQDAGGGAMENIVMWNSTRWTKVDAGRERLITKKMENGVIRSRYATWVILRSRTNPDAQIVVIATHMPVNPEGVGGQGGVIGNRGTSYSSGMDALVALINTLAAYGPVLTGGDFNNHPYQTQSWAAVPHMTAVGYAYTDSPKSGIDYVFYPRSVQVVGLSDLATGGTSDHPYYNVTELNMNGAGPNAASGRPSTNQADAVQPVAAPTSSGCQPCPTGSSGDSITLTSATTGPLHDAEVAAAAAYQAGFRGNDLYTMVWIAGGESSYNTHAINHYSSGGHTYYVYGLWQISSIHAGVSVPGIYDPLANARQAFALYLGRGGSKLGDGGPASRFDDWSAHTAANEAKYGPTARKAIAAVAGGTIPAVATCNTGSNLPAGMTGSGNFTPNTSVPYVGPYSPGELVARMQKIMALNGSGGNLDPFFGTEPDGSWYHDCQHFVANLDGRSSSGYGSAASAWSHFLSTGAAHPAGSADGMSPPAGAWLYYGDNHVVVYLGNNLVAGTDTWGTGTAKIGPAADVQKWLASQGGYKGWVVPWGAPVKSSLAA